jgi:hypothetical protein
MDSKEQLVKDIMQSANELTDSILDLVHENCTKIAVDFQGTAVISVDALGKIIEMAKSGLGNATHGEHIPTSS